MKHKITSLLLASVLALSLSACSSGSSGSSGSSTNSETEESVETGENAESTESTESSTGKETPPADAILFETTDFDGNPVSSVDIFKENKLTIIKLWGTYCGPSIMEMPGLEDLSGRLAEKGCAIVGVVIDVAGTGDTTGLEAAKDIVTQTGVTYLNVFPWDTLGRDFPAEFIPTTYFVDSEGRLVGDPVIGANEADGYEKIIDSLLDL